MAQILDGEAAGEVMQLLTDPKVLQDSRVVTKSGSKYIIPLLSCLHCAQHLIPGSHTLIVSNDYNIVFNWHPQCTCGGYAEYV